MPVDLYEELEGQQGPVDLYDELEAAEPDSQAMSFLKGRRTDVDDVADEAFDPERKRLQARRDKATSDWMDAHRRTGKSEAEIQSLLAGDVQQPIDHDYVQGDLAQRAEQTALDRQIMEDRIPGYKNAFVRGATQGMAEAGGRIESLLRRPFQDDQADAVNEQTERFQRVAGEVDEASLSPTLSRSWRGIVSSSPSLVAGAVGGPAAAIGVATIDQANQAITEGRQAGLSGKKLAMYSAGQGAIEGTVTALFQKAGFGGFESIGKRTAQRGLMQGLKRIPQTLAQELPEEVIIGVGQQVSRKLSDVDPDALSAETLRQVIVDTVVQTVLTAGLIESPTFARAAADYAAKKFPSRKDAAKIGADGMNAAQRKQLADDIRMIQARGRQAPVEQASVEPLPDAGQVAVSQTPEAIVLPDAVVPAQEQAVSPFGAEVTPDQPLQVVEATQAAVPQDDQFVDANKMIDPTRDLRRYEHERGYDQIVLKGRNGFRSLANQAKLAARDADTRYAELKRLADNSRRKSAADFTKGENVTARAQGLQDAAGGAMTPDALKYAPLHTLPPDLTATIQREAAALLPETKSDRTKAALEKIIKDAGSDTGAAVEGQKERIVGILSGELDQRTIAERQFGEPPRPVDPVFQVLLSPGEERSRLVAAAIRSVEAGRPDELAMAAQARLEEGAGAAELAEDFDPWADESPSAVSPDEVVEWLTALGGMPSPTQTRQIGPPQGQQRTVPSNEEAAPAGGERQRQQPEGNASPEFTLANAPPRVQPAKFDDSDRSRQKALLSGLDALPGQMDLIEDVDSQDEVGSRQSAVDSAKPPAQKKWKSSRTIMAEIGKIEKQLDRGGGMRVGPKRKELETKLGSLWRDYHAFQTEESQQKASMRTAGVQAMAGGTPSVPTSPTGTGKPISSNEIVATLEREFGLPIRRGRLRGKKLLGIYKQKPEVIRLNEKTYGELATATHEVAHHIDKQTGASKGVPTSLRKEVAALDYEPAKARMSEGFAEFIRLFLTDPQGAQQRAPGYSAYFPQWLQQNQKFIEPLRHAKNLIAQWSQTQGAGERIKGQISQTGKPAKPLDVPRVAWLKDRITEVIHRTYASWKDEGHDLNRFTKAAKDKGYKPDAGDSPYELYAAMTQNGPTFAMKAVQDGVFKLTGTMDQIGPGLNEVFADIGQAEYGDFVSWMYARHALETTTNSGIDPADAQYWFDLHKNNQKWVDAADKFSRFNDALIEMLADAGVITDDTATRIIDSYKSYVPLMRVRDGMKKAGLGGRKVVDLSAPLKRRSGSNLQIIDPVQATIERAVRFYERAAQQQVQNKIIEAAEKVDGMGGWIEPVPPNMTKTTISMAELLPNMVDTFAAAGIDPDVLEQLAEEVDPNDIINIFKPDYYYKGDQPIARVLKNGQPKLYQFDKDLFRAVSGMNYFQIPWFINIVIGAPARLARMGATALSPAFAAKNIARDYLGYLFQKKHAPDSLRGAVKPFEMIGSYVYSQAMQVAGKEADPIVRLWQEMGGELSQELGLDRRRIRKTVENVVSNSTQRRVLNIVKHPIDALRNVIGVSEVGPRLAEFEAVLNKHGHSRKSIRSGKRVPRNVLVEAINAANDVTVNFKRMGYYGKWANKMIPFFNATLEGHDKFVRTGIDNPKRTFLAAAALAAATALYWLSRRDDDDYKEAQGWLKWGFWTITDDEGKPVARIPRPQDWGWTVSAGTEAILEAIDNRDPGELQSYLGEAGKQAAPPIIPAVAGPAIETYFNEDTFRDQPIVGRELEYVKPKDQFYPHTTLTARKLGEWLNMSPAKIEHYLTQQSGGLFRNATTTAEAILTDRELGESDEPLIGGFKLRKDYSQTVDDFYDHVESVRQEVGSTKLRGDVPLELDREAKHLQEYSDLMAELRAPVRGNPDRDERFQHEKYIIGLSRAAMGKKKLDRYPNPLTAGDLPPGVQKVRDDFLGRKVYAATDPDPEKQPDETWNKYSERRRNNTYEGERARKWIDESKLSRSEAKQLLRRVARRKALKLDGKAFTDRLDRADRL